MVFLRKNSTPQACPKIVGAYDSGTGRFNEVGHTAAKQLH